MLQQITCCNELASANAIGSNRLLLVNINDISSRSRARLCIALRLVGGSEAAGCNNGFPCDRPRVEQSQIEVKICRYLPATNGSRCGGGGGGGGGIGGNNEGPLLFAVADGDDESFVLPKCKCVCE